jgi:hypothetical protein
MFFRNKGFSAFLNLLNGDVELLANKAARRQNTRIECSPESVISHDEKQGFYDWRYRRKLYLYVCSKLNFAGKLRLLSDLLCPFALLAAVVLCLCVGNVLTILTAALLFVLRFAVQVSVVNKNSKYTGGGKFFLSLLFFDYISPFVDLKLLSEKKKHY